MAQLSVITVDRKFIENNALSKQTRIDMKKTTQPNGGEHFNEKGSMTLAATAQQ